MTVIDTSEGTRPVVPRPLKLSSGWLAGLGGAAGLGALVSSSCCVLPLALASLGAGSAVFAGLEFLAEVRPYLLGGATLVLLLAWMAFLRRGTTACNADGDDHCGSAVPNTRKAALLGVGTGVVGLAIIWDAFIEPVLLKLVR
jgi:mercuric ion transport protein